MSIALLIADDHKLVRSSLRRLFEEAGMSVAAEADKPSQVLSRALDPRVQLVLLDIVWIDPNESELQDAGYDLLREIRTMRPMIPVLMYSEESSPQCIARCRSLGANGYLIKGLDDGMLVPAVRLALRGEQIWPDLPRARHTGPVDSRTGAPH